MLVLQRPYLEVQIREQTSVRPRRTTSLNCDEFGAEQRCCRYPLIVDFQAFQWNWIIAPKRYAAFYCSGVCPFRYFTTYPHSALVQMTQERQATSNNTSRLNNNAGPCCAPIKTSNITMLHYNDEGNVVVSILPDMVVDQCGCSWESKPSVNSTSVQRLRSVTNHLICQCLTTIRLSNKNS